MAHIWKLESPEWYVKEHFVVTEIKDFSIALRTHIENINKEYLEKLQPPTYDGSLITRITYIGKS